jgi:SAM-dependent methyltransferase
VDYIDDLTTTFKQSEIEMCGEALKVDIVAPGDQLPVPDESQDFVVSSHVIEHFFDPIRAIEEWLRVVRPGGYVFIIAPHKERTFDRDRPRTALAEIIDRHTGKISPPAQDTHEHYSVWITEDFLEVCAHFGFQVVDSQDVDDKVGNGFTIVIHKPAQPRAGQPDLSETARQWLGAVYGRLLEDAPADAGLLLHLGLCSRALRDGETARRYFERVLLIDPANRSARLSLPSHANESANLVTNPDEHIISSPARI